MAVAVLAAEPQRETRDTFLGRLIRTCDILDGADTILGWAAENGCKVVAPWEDPRTCRYYIVKMLQAGPRMKNQSMAFVMALPFATCHLDMESLHAVAGVCELLEEVDGISGSEEMTRLEKVAATVEEQGAISNTVAQAWYITKEIIEARMAAADKSQDKISRRNALSYCNKMAPPLWWTLAAILAARGRSISAALQMAMVERFGMLSDYPSSTMKARIPLFLFASGLTLEDIICVLKANDVPLIKILETGDTLGLFDHQLMPAVKPRRPELVGYRTVESKDGINVVLERLGLTCDSPGTIRFGMVFERIYSQHELDWDTRADALRWAVLNARPLRWYKRSRFLLSSALLLLAAHPDCPGWVLKALSASHLSTARAVAALRNPDAPPEELLRILSRQRSGIYWFLAAVLTHPNCPVELKMSILMQYSASTLKRNWPHVARVIGI